MDVPLEEKVLALEMEILSTEAMRNHTRLQYDENPARGKMALVQVDVCHGLMEYLIQNEDWSNFNNVLYDALEDEYSHYLEAWAAHDRDDSRVAMARIRIMTKLARRLADPKRRQLIEFEFEGPVVVN